MTMLSELKAEGWYLTPEGLDSIINGSTGKPSKHSIIKKALDMDLREIGGNFFPEDSSKGKLDHISGPGVVQIQKIKNASAPKYEYGSGAPPILRLLLTDGNNYINCLQWGQWKSIFLDTPPGTKIYLKPTKINMQSNFLLLSEHQFTVLGGCVAALVEKWELNRKLASHIRSKNLDGTGPPPWIPFGQPIAKHVKTANFKSLEPDAKDAKEDAAFKQQRQATIAEIAKVKEIKAKSFGGRKEKPPPSKSEHANTSYMQSNTYTSAENDYKRTPYSAQDSPIRNRSAPNDRNRKNTRNDYTQVKYDNARSQASNNNDGSQYNPKDNKLENKNKLGDFITENIKQHSAFQAKSESEPSHTSFSRQYKPSYKDYRQSSDRRPQKDDSRDLVNMMEQVKIFGYDAKDDRNSFVSGNSTLRKGMEVMAKYWEDDQYYRAEIHAVGNEGNTCVVRFLDYGNYEEVLVKDVHERNSFREKNWNAGPVSFMPSSRNNENYSVPHKQSYNNDASKSNQNSNRMYNRPNRTEYKHTAKFYQSPN